MKVLQLLPALEQGGVETVVCDLNRVVVGNGWESVIVSKGGRLAARIEADGGRHVTLDVKSKNPLTYPIRVWRLRRIIRSEKPDLVCVHSRVPAWLYVGVRTLDSLLSKIKQSNNQTIKQSLPPWLTYAHGANSVSRYSAVMTKGDLTVTPSRFLADYLKANYGLAEEKIRVIHPSVDVKRFDPGNLDRAFIDEKRCAWGLTPESFVVMAVGRVTPVKGYDTLIRTVARLAVGLPHLKLVIVGGADKHHLRYLESLKSLASSLVPPPSALVPPPSALVPPPSSLVPPPSSLVPPPSSLIFAGQQEKVPECLSLASVVVSANTKKPESYGLSMAEALMMGKPVIAKAFGGALDIVRDGVDGVLVPMETESEDEAFARAIVQLRDHPFGDLRASAKERFSFDAMSVKTLRTYEDAVRWRKSESRS